MNDDAINASHVSRSQLREALQIASRIARLATKSGDTEFIEKLLNILVAKEIERYTAGQSNPPEVNGETPLAANGEAPPEVNGETPLNPPINGETRLDTPQ